MRPRLLDLFCKVGGATRGYQEAGFYVVGVDHEPQPNYCGDEFILADALEVPLDGYDAIHASPPCQAYTEAINMRAGYESKFPKLIAPIRERLLPLGIPYVIENVVGARLDLRSPTLLCGETFGLRVRRHRLFESSCLLFGSYCQHHGDIVGVYGDHPEDAHVSRAGGIRRARTVQEAKDAMGMPWVETWSEVKEAIPPAFTRFLGEQLLAHLEAAA